MRITSDGKVGIGISSINGVFTAYGTPMTAISAQTVADIFGDVQQDADKGGGIGLGGRYITDSSSVTAFAEISGVKANNTSSNYEGEMVFKTRVNGGNLIERMRLDTNSRISLSNNLDANTGNTIFGASAWNIASTSTNNDSDHNTLIGASVMGAGTIAGASHNIAIGGSALNDATSASDNVAIGSSAMLNATTVVGNVAIGRQAMGLGVLTGEYNIAIGKASGFDLTTGEYNILMGFNAGVNITTASKNIFIGGNAGDAVTTTGSSNVSDGTVGVGHNVLSSLTSGAKNTAVGYLAGDALTVGAENVTLGYNSLGAEVEGTSNTAIGYDALKIANAGGSNGAGTTTGNTALGTQAGNALTTGKFNTFLGAGTDASANSGENQTVIGFGATGVADNSVTLGNTDVTKIYMNQNGNGKVVLGTIEFDASQATLSTNANTLDDYEEGDYDATVTCSTSGTITLEGAYNRLAYVKVGRSVTVTGLLIVNAVSSPSGFINISLPFAIGDGTDKSQSFSGAVQIQGANAILSRDFVNLGVEGESVVRVYVGDASGLQSDSAEGIIANAQLYIGITYQV